MGEHEAQRERLRDTLADLETELREAEGLETALAARLRNAVADLRAALDRTERGESQPSEEPAIAERHTLADHLRDETRRFEVSHPRLSEALGRVVDALANLGI